MTLPAFTMFIGFCLVGGFVYGLAASAWRDWRRNR